MVLSVCIALQFVSEAVQRKRNDKVPEVEHERRLGIKGGLRMKETASTVVHLSLYSSISLLSTSTGFYHVCTGPSYFPLGDALQHLRNR